MEKEMQTGRVAAIPQKEPETPNLNGVVAQAVLAARGAQQSWAKMTLAARRIALGRARAFIVEHADRIAKTIAACTGKTLIDALSTEVLPAAIAIRHYARLAPRVLRAKLQHRSTILFFNKRTVIAREPYGVVGIITPWNYPFGIPFHEVFTGLLCGNAVVLKVATIAAPVGELISEMLRSTGIPDGLLSLVSVPGSAAGRALIEARVDKLFFTGSTDVGRELMETAGRALIPVNLELGGNDAMLVLSDANLHRAAHGAAWAGLSNCGQSCAAVERIYVEAPVYDEFLRLLNGVVSSLRHGQEPVAGEHAVDIGTLSTHDQVKTVRTHIEQALESGARQAASSKGPDAFPGSLVHPAIVVEVAGDAGALMRDETFGPVIAVERVADEATAIEKANGVNLGLTASVWSSAPRRARAVAKRLQAGTVTINDHLMSHGMPEASWGGYKDSGIGRSHGIAGFIEMTQEKAIVSELTPWASRNFYWYPHNAGVYASLKAALDVVASKSPLRRLGGAFRVARAFFSATGARRTVRDSGPTVDPDHSGVPSASRNNLK